MGRTAIYALTEPDGGAIRYVGKANNPAKRFRSHLRDSRRRRTPVYLWINRLAKAGKSPGMVVLEWCEQAEWPDVERRLIAEHRTGGQLLNLAEGGDQPLCPTKVRRANAVALNARMAADPLLYRVREMNRAMAAAHKAGRLSEKAKANLRLAAVKRPDLFGRWASI